VEDQIAVVLHRLIAAEDHDVDFLDAAGPVPLQNLSRGA
jgi:hypothetical protein